MMKLPNDETQDNDLNGDGYLSDEFDHLEMIPAPIRDGDFSEYMWMENEEEFNSQVLRELEEEELMEQCINAMLNDEETAEESDISNNRTINNILNDSVHGLSDSVNNLSLSSNGFRSNASSDFSNNYVPNISNNCPRFSLQNRLANIRTSGVNNSLNTSATNGNDSEEQKSNLNPDAKEFVPLYQTNTETNSVDENLHS